MRTLSMLAMGFLVGIGASNLAVAEQHERQASTGSALLATIAKHLQVRPGTAIDFSDVSGEYCFNAGLGRGGQMTHYAISPESTREDVIDFVNAASFLAAGIKVEDLPRFPGTLGSMTPNQWYFLPAGEFEPHHGGPFPVPLLIKATSLE